MMAGENKFLVQHKYGAEFVVDLRVKNMSNAISCIFSMDDNMYDYTWFL